MLSNLTWALILMCLYCLRLFISDDRKVTQGSYMKTLQVKIEYDSLEEFESDRKQKYSECFSESTVIMKKDGKIIVLWKNLK